MITTFHFWQLQLLPCWTMQIKSAFIRLFETHSKREIGKFVLNKTKDCIGLLLGLLERNRKDGGWFFRVMCDPIEENVDEESADGF